MKTFLNFLILFLSFSVIFSSDEFFLGWYSDSNSEYLKVLVGIKDNKYGYIDPYSKYYNLFLNYSVFNYFILPDSINISKTTPFLHIPDSLLLGKHFIADIPRYSSLFRLLFTFPPGEKNQDKTTFTIRVFDSIHNTVNNSNDSGIFTGRNSRYPVYSYFSFEDFCNSGNYAIFDLNEEKILLDKNRPYVYTHGDILGFSYRLLNNKGWFCTEVKIVSKKGPLNLRIFSSSDVGILIPIKKNEHNIGLFLDGFISLDFSEKKNSDFTEMYNIDIVISDPSLLLLQDSVYKSFELNIKKFAELAGIEVDSILDFVFYLKDAEIADVLLSFSNEFSLNVLKETVDRIMKKDKSSLLGFYTADEIERSEVFFHDRWMRIYMPEIYPNGKINKKKKHTLLYVQDSIRSYIKSINKIPFTLSTIHFYTESKNTISEYNDVYSIYADSFIFYDDYSYTASFLNNFLKIRKLADSLSLKILYVGDAYSTKSKASMGFIKMKWKFFTPIIMGADGMLFFSYYLPKVKSYSQLLSDTNKMNIGYFTKYFTDTGMRISIQNSKRFITKLENNSSRISSVFNDTTGNIFFMYFITKKNSPMTNALQKKYFSFYKSDADLNEIKKLMREKDYYIADITPYIESSAFNQEIITSENSVAIKNESLCDSTNIIYILNKIPFCELNSDFDIKIIRFSSNKEILFKN